MWPCAVLALTGDQPGDAFIKLQKYQAKQKFHVKTIILLKCCLPVASKREKNKIYARLAYKIYRCFMLANTKTGYINEAVQSWSYRAPKIKEGSWPQGRALPFLCKLETVQLSVCYKCGSKFQLPFSLEKQTNKQKTKPTTFEMSVFTKFEVVLLHSPTSSKYLMGFLTQLLHCFGCFFLKAQIYLSKGTVHLHEVTYLNQSKGGQSGLSHAPQLLVSNKARLTPWSKVCATTTLLPCHWGLGVQGQATRLLPHLQEVTCGYPTSLQMLRLPSGWPSVGLCYILASLLPCLQLFILVPSLAGALD